MSEQALALAGAEGANTPRSLGIEVYFDFVCPWCLIGKRHLDAALRRLAVLRPEVDVQITWRSHALLPDTPAAGLPYQAFYVARLGSPEAVAMRRAQVQQAAMPAGLRFEFDRIAVLPNTAVAHARVAQASEAQRARLIDRLFSAYFMEGEDIGNADVVERLAMECVGAPHDKPHAPSRPERRHAVNGVPFFVFDGAMALSGAVSPDVMLDALLGALGD